MLQFPPFARGNHAPRPPPATDHRATRPPTPDHAQPQRAPTNHNLARPATPGRLPAQPPLTGPLNGGFCTIRRTATACRRRVAPLMLQFPPFARGNHGPARHQRRITGPRPAHPAANAGPHPATTRPNQPRLRPPTHTQPPNRGFCTIRRTATACRRRVAPLMLQFPPIRPQQPRPRPPPATDHQAAPGPRGRQPPPAPVHNAPQPTATSPARPHPVVCPPSHRSPAHSPGGFAPLDAPLRRVAGVSHP